MSSASSISSTYTTHSILSNIVQTKHQEVQGAKQQLSLAEIQATALKMLEDPKYTRRNFVQALQYQHIHHPKKSAVIAEIKQASPSKGIICKNFVVADIAKAYTKNHAACLSVLTDEIYFKGHSTYLMQAKNATHIPILRKDFIVDIYQIYQSYIMGADAILLIANILSLEQMLEFEHIAHNLGMAVLPEVHDAQELTSAMQLKTPLVGINNRNLSTFDVNIQQTIDLLDAIQNTQKIVITESGITSNIDVNLMRQNNVHTFLVGEAFMRQPTSEMMGQALTELFS
jgi:indole-3-glycerol phosphate synthase